MKSAPLSFYATISADQDPVATPFIPMSRIHRLAIIGAFWASVLVIAVLALLNQTPDSAMVILGLVVAVTIQLFPLLSYRSSFGWFHPLVFTTLYSFIALLRGASTYIWGLQNPAGLIGYSTAELAWFVTYGLLLGAIGQVAYYIGFFALRGFRIPQLKFFQPRFIGLKVFLIVLITLGIFLAYMENQGGIEAYLLFLARGRSNLINAGELSGEWLVLFRFAILACLIWLGSDPNATRRPLFWISVVIALAMQFLVSGSRSSVIIIIAIGVVIWMLRAQKISAPRILVGIIVGLFLLGQLGSFRTSLWSGDVNWDTLIEPSGVISVGQSIDELQERSGSSNPLYPILARVPSEIDLLYGRSYLTLLTTPIPRAWWPEKPRSTGAEVGEIFLNTLAPTPPGVIGEAYWNFHIPGVVLVFLLFGFFHKGLALFYTRYASESAVVVLYAVTLFVFFPDVLSIVTWLQFLIQLVLLLFVFGIVSHSTTRLGVD